MKNIESYIGKKFDRVLILSIVSFDKIEGKCDCGTVRIFPLSNLTRGLTKSCGCYGREQVKIKNFKHGFRKHPLYKIWRNIKSRCYNPKVNNYKDYGGRGISVCNEWLNSVKEFCDWALANGYEKGLSIDRIDNDGNYEPSNCRWATRIIQERNKRTNVFYEYKGESKTLVEWAEIFTEIKYVTLKARLQKGWDFTTAIETPKKINRYC